MMYSVLSSFVELFLDHGYGAAVLEAHGIGIVGVHVHLQAELVADTNLYVEPAGTLGAAEGVHGNVVAVLHTEASTVGGTHVDVAVGDDAALLQGNDTLGADDGNGGGACQRAGLTDGRLDLQDEGVGDRDLNLALLAVNYMHHLYSIHYHYS